MARNSKVAWKWGQPPTCASAKSSAPHLQSRPLRHLLLQLLQPILRPRPYRLRLTLKNELDGGKAAFGGRGGAGGVQDSRDCAHGCASDVRNQVQPKIGKFSPFEWPQGFPVAHQRR